MVDLAALRAVNPNSIPATLLFLRCGRDAFDRIEATVTAEGGNARITSRHEALAAVIDDPFIRSSRGTLRAVVVAAAEIALIGRSRTRLGRAPESSPP